jgi:hypothetical protein
MKYYLLLIFTAIACTDNSPNLETIEGIWGSDTYNTQITISSSKTVFEFTCAAAEIDSDITQKTEDKFEVSGIYVQQFGTIPVDFDPAKYRYPAKFIFTRKNNKLTVQITKKDTNEALVNFTYLKDKNVQVIKCP